VIFYLFGASFVISIFTGLRFFGPIGFGEVYLVGVLLFVLLYLWRKSIFLSVMSAQYLALIFLYQAVLLVGWVWGSIVGVSDFAVAIRDFVAIVFGGGVFLGLLLCFASKKDDFITAQNYFYQGVRDSVLFVLCPVFLISMFWGHLFGVSLWYHDIIYYKWTGFSNNPNQVALLSSILPLFFIKIYSVCRYKLFAFCYLAITLSVGVFTMSSALQVSWIAGFCFYFINDFRSANKIFLRLACFVFLFMCGVVAVLYSKANVLITGYVNNFITSDGGQGESRLVLWSNAILAIEKSPFVGFGPGSFSGYNGPFGKEEAHNIFIDIGTNTGVIGGVIFFIFLFSLLVFSVVRKRRFSGALLASLISYSLFHYTLRMPIFWCVCAFVVADLFESSASRREID